MEHQMWLWLILAIPFVGAGFTSLFGRWPNIREGFTLLTSSALFYCVVQLWLGFKQGETFAYKGIMILPSVPFSLVAEPLGVLFALLASFLWIVTSVYSIGYMRGNKERNQTRFYVFFAIALTCAMGIAFAGNLLTLFVFYELLTISTYPLVTHSGTEAAKKAGRTYLGILLFTSVAFLLVAMLWTWHIAGTLDFTTGGILWGKVDSSATVAVLFFLFIYGVGKAALMPIHRWLPAAMVAPTPVSALLHAVAVVKAGVFTIIKIMVYIFGVDFLNSAIQQNWWAGGWLVYMAGATVLIASLVALKQDNLKRLLAYSTISQLSYVIMAAATLAKESIMAAAFHIAAHGFGKITLFFAAGSIYTASKKKNVSDLAGIGKRMPWTMTAFAIGALSMIAVPPTAGFLTKWHMISGAFDRGNFFVITTLVISTVLNVLYFLPIVFVAFFKPETTVHVPGNLSDHGEAPLPIVIALIITAAGTIGLFFYPDIFQALAKQVAGIK